MAKIKNYLDYVSSNEMPNYAETVIADFHQKAVREFDQKLKEYVIKNLNHLGFIFTTDLDFIQFVSTRITRVAFEDKPDYYELFLDYNNETKHGTLIGTYSTKTVFENNGCTMTVKIG